MVAQVDNIVLGGGCFWCLEASYQLINGVTAVVCGYAGGHTNDPDYYKVAMMDTGHAEVVQVTFDPTIISLSDILDIFWALHNPTTLNRQGADVGSEYRSIILFNNETQATEVDKSLMRVRKLWDDPIVTEFAKLDKFYEAEPEQQNFFAKHPEAGYCQVVINPKLAKLRQKFTNKLKAF
jgi:peptide-methionine (S)-S-oxide reductase